MQTVRFLQDAGGYKKGMTVEIQDTAAHRLADAQVVVLVEQAPRLKIAEGTKLRKLAPSATDKRPATRVAMEGPGDLMS